MTNNNEVKDHNSKIIHLIPVIYKSQFLLLPRSKGLKVLMIMLSN